MTELEDYQQRFPLIAWAEPIKITVGRATGYACRICIAQHGIRGTEVADLPSDKSVIEAHIREAHTNIAQPARGDGRMGTG